MKNFWKFLRRLLGREPKDDSDNGWTILPTDEWEGHQSWQERQRARSERHKAHSNNPPAWTKMNDRPNHPRK